jgi:site-specific recombinase XerD
MLTPHRRHLRTCEFASKGWNYTLCDCPIWCDGKLNGERFRRSLDTANWERALRRIRRLERGEDQDFTEVAPGRSLADAITAYTKDVERRKLADSTQRSYKKTLDTLSDQFDELAIADLTDTHITDFLTRAQMEATTQRKEIEHLRAFCAFAVNKGWLAKNVAKLVKPPKSRDFLTLPYTREEVTSLLNACDRMRAMWRQDLAPVRQRARAVILALLYSGLRVSDIAKLRRSSLEPSNHLVLHGLNPTQKNKVPVKVLLHRDAADALRNLPAPAGNPTYFFWSGHGDYQDCAKSLWRTVARIGKLAGVHAHPHRFRDTFAVELLSNGADIRTVQKLLGHKSVKTTELHYAHFVDAHQKILDSAASTLDFSPTPARPLLVSGFKNRRRNTK